MEMNNTCFRAPKDELEQLERLAQEQGINQSQVIRDALKVYSDLWDKGKKQNPELVYFLFTLVEHIEKWEPEKYEPPINENTPT